MRPKQPTETVTDAEGAYDVFPGKHCKAPKCGVALTSRNRYSDRLLCIEHGRAMDRDAYINRTPQVRSLARYRVEGIGEIGEQAAPTEAAPLQVNTPKHAKAPTLPPLPRQLHAAIATWLNSPGAGYAVEMLRVAMRNYELAHRLKRLIPPTPTPPPIGPIPVEEDHPLFAHPAYRTTKEEFLADCIHHRA